MTPFVDALLAAPLGVTLLAELERAARPDTTLLELLEGSDPDAVERAAAGVARRPLGLLLADAVDLLAVEIGPWNSDPGSTLAAAYEHAEARRPIAEAVDAAFGETLHAGPDLDDQRWWHSDTPADGYRRLAALPGAAYAAGQMPWRGIWTSNPPAEEAVRSILATSEIEPEPVSQWRFEVAPSARIQEIHRPEDWAALVREHPRLATPGREGWELPGRNQPQRDLRSLLARPDQRAARTEIRRHLVPDWASVAAEVDGVHLSWAGVLTSEGCITDLGDGDVAMLRYWFVECTHWLNDALGEPEPLGPPLVDNPADVRTDARRAAQDLEVIRVRLSRAS